MASDLSTSYTRLGKSGFRVSRICLGTMTFGNPITESDASRLVGHAIDRGINFFDTANSYEGYDRTFCSSGGVSEKILGRALEGRRNKVVICTKFANPVGTGPLDGGLSARHLEDQLHNSLRNLQTDCIDLVLAHRWDAGAHVEEVWRVFDRWIRAGKVMCVGVSNWPSWRMAQAAELASQNSWSPLTVSSPRYNLFDRAIEAEHIPCALQYGVTLLTYQPLHGGVLTGKYSKSNFPPADSRAAEKPGWVSVLDDAAHCKLEQLEQLARHAGMSMTEYVLAWTLSRAAVGSVVVGCRTPEQLDAVLRSTLYPFPSGDTDRIDKIFPPTGSDTQVLDWDKTGWKLQPS